MPELYVVVRTIGEETFDKCLHSVRERDLPYSIVENFKPLQEAVKQTMVEGLKSEADWVMALDADIILTMDAEKIIRYCDIMKRLHEEIEDIRLFCFTGYIDCTERGVTDGIHFYNGDYLQEFYDRIKYASFVERGRAEYSMKKLFQYENLNRGYRWRTGCLKMPFGKHYF